MNKRLMVSVLAVVAAVAGVASYLLGGWSTKNMDLVLLVDTSASMVGKPSGPNIFPDVKRELRGFVDEARKGDSVTLLTFSSDFNQIVSVPIEDRSRDVKRLQAEIESLEAPGQWTYMARALEQTMLVAEDVFKMHPDNVHVAVLLSDGKNDPPPGHREAADYDLGGKTRGYEGKPWYVYYISLGSAPDSSFKEAVAGFDKGKTVESRGAKNLRKEMSEIRNQVAMQRAIKILKTVGIILGCLILAALILFLAGRARGAHLGGLLSGTLEYFEISKPDQRSKADLSEFGQKEIKIGAGPGCRVMVPSSGGAGGTIAVIRKRTVDGIEIPHLSVQGNSAIRHHGVSLRELRLYDRDEFEVGDIGFVYRNGELPRRHE